MNFSILPSFLFSKKIKPTKLPQKPPSQMIEPLKRDFESTKDLFTYARKRCVDALHSDKPYEHTVLVDTKQNKVIAEILGDTNSCSLDCIENLQFNKDYSILMHGHPSGTPISTADVSAVLNTPVNQVIAFDKDGKFSLVSKKIDKKPNVSREFTNYKLEQYDLADGMTVNGEFELYNKATDYVLKKHAPLMGLRYLSNYAYALKN